MSYLSEFATHGLIPSADHSRAAEAALIGASARDPQLLEALVSRAEISPEGWLSLWSLGKSSALRTSLVSRPLANEAIRHALSDEKRPSVLAALLNNNPVPAVFSGLRPATVKGPLASALALCQSAPSSLRIQAAMNAGLVPRLAVSAELSASELDDKQVLTWISEGNFEEVKTRRMSSRWLTRVLSVRPGLFSYVLGLSDPVTTVACGSVNLPANLVPLALNTAGTNRFALLSLIANPAVDAAAIEPVLLARRFDDELGYEVRRSLGFRVGRPAVQFPVVTDDPETLAWLVRRSCATDARPSGRPLEASALLGTRAQERWSDQLRSVFETALDDRVWGELAREGLQRLGVQAVPPRPVSCYLSTPSRPLELPAIADQKCRWVSQPQLAIYAAHALGSDQRAWEVFVALVPDFEGSVEELCRAAVTL